MFAFFIFPFKRVISRAGTIVAVNQTSYLNVVAHQTVMNRVMF